MSIVSDLSATLMALEFGITTYMVWWLRAGVSLISRTLTSCILSADEVRTKGVVQLQHHSIFPLHYFWNRKPFGRLCATVYPVYQSL
jgi:hypothetical protein